MNQQEPEIPQHRIANDEIDLVDLFLIVWKRRWLIVIVTLLVTLAAVGLSMAMPKTYEVSTILEPGKDVEGSVAVNPQTIRENIIGGAFDREISEKLGIDLKQMPLFKVTVPKNTDLVTIKVESSKPDEAVKVLNELLTLLSSNIEEQLDAKRNLILNDLKSLEIKRNLFPTQIAQLDSLVTETKRKISDLELARKQIATDVDSAAMPILLYLNEIQNQQVFLNSLYEKINALKVREDDAELKITQLKIKQATIKGININKQPSIPEQPIKPKKILIVVLAFVLGLMGSVMLVFLAEFMNKVRQQQKIQGEG